MAALGAKGAGPRRSSRRSSLVIGNSDDKSSPEKDKELSLLAAVQQSASVDEKSNAKNSTTGAKKQ